MSLYDGQSGIVLYLYLLAKLTGYDRYLSLARRGKNYLLRSLLENSDSSESNGGYVGESSAAFALLAIDAIMDGEGEVDLSLKVLENCEKELEKVSELDVISGVAGLCLIATQALKISESRIMERLVKRCVDHLLAHADQTQSYLSWRTLDETPPLCGVSHGNAGIAMALSAAGTQLGDLSIIQQSIRACEFEKQKFNQTDRNWPDRRIIRSCEAPVYQVTWCHGAPGIGLSRISMAQHQKTNQKDNEIRTAAANVASHRQ